MESKVEGKDRAASPPPAFWDLWSTHQDQLRRKCIRMMAGNVADGEDALGNALVRASSHLARYGGSEITYHRAWLFRVVHNSCIDFYRARSSQERGNEEMRTTGESNMGMAMPERTPEEAFETKEALNSLQTAIDALPERLRTPMVLRFLDGLSYAEISARLRISRCSARKRIQVGRKRLLSMNRQLLKEPPPTGDVVQWKTR